MNNDWIYYLEVIEGHVLLLHEYNERRAIKRFESSSEDGLYRMRRVNGLLEIQGWSISNQVWSGNLWDNERTN